jgi:hypothetical protein
MGDAPFCSWCNRPFRVRQSGGAAMVLPAILSASVSCRRAILGARCYRQPTSRTAFPQRVRCLQARSHPCRHRGASETVYA